MDEYDCNDDLATRIAVLAEEIRTQQEKLEAEKNGDGDGDDDGKDDDDGNREKDEAHIEDMLREFNALCALMDQIQSTSEDEEDDEDIMVLHRDA